MNSDDSKVEIGPDEAPKRLQVNINLSVKTKAFIERVAEDEGLSQGRAVEMLIERCQVYDRLVAAMERSLEQVKAGKVEEVFRTAGYRPMRSNWGQCWVPKNYPITRGAGLGGAGDLRKYIPMENQNSRADP